MENSILERIIEQAKLINELIDRVLELEKRVKKLENPEWGQTYDDVHMKR